MFSPSLKHKTSLLPGVHKKTFKAGVSQHWPACWSGPDSYQVDLNSLASHYIQKSGLTEKKFPKMSKFYNLNHYWSVIQTFKNLSAGRQTNKIKKKWNRELMLSKKAPVP